jgi:hypothetical protein
LGEEDTSLSFSFELFHSLKWIVINLHTVTSSWILIWRHDHYIYVYIYIYNQFEMWLLYLNVAPYGKAYLLIKFLIFYV